MKTTQWIICFLFALTVLACDNQKPAQTTLTDYVNPFLGTATLWDTADLKYTPTRRAWGAEVFPGASLPNAMVQVSPVTMFRSGAGYQYEDTVIFAFTHTNKGHWNLCHVPFLPFTGEITPDHYYSGYSHDNESACPGYYQVFLEKYGINVELTSTLRCAYHKYIFNEGDEKKMLADLSVSNEGVRNWEIHQTGDNVFTGFQQTGETVYFYAVSNHEITGIDSLKSETKTLPVISFEKGKESTPVELKVGFSFVSIENAKKNLEQEMLAKKFDQIKKEADQTWDALLSKIQVKGGTDRQRGIFYSCLYRSFLWPVLRSDVNGDFTDKVGEVVNKGFRYYTNPSFWDDYRNKLILLGMISPDVATDVLKSIIDKGEKSDGYMPTFFHGDHASTFVSGSYLRGIKDFDIERAYKLLLKNATVSGHGGRPYLDEYIEQGWIAEKDTTNVPIHDEYKAAVTKTVEYAYDDYATALIAKELNDEANYTLLMQRSGNYKNLFDSSTGFWRGRIADGSWIKDFDPYHPYYAYMYREANAWNSLFFAPHDTEGMLKLYPDREAVEKMLDSLFTEPWRGYEAHNMTGFIGNYCHGNQPGHSIPYIYYFIGKQEKAQGVLDTLMNHFYDMGEDRLAYPGMDDAGEMSSWFVLNAIGLYTFSPADPEYIVTVPLFDEVKFVCPESGVNFTILKKNHEKKITDISLENQKIDSYFVTHDQLKEGKKLIITTQPE